MDWPTSPKQGFQEFWKRMEYSYKSLRRSNISAGRVILGKEPQLRCPWLCIQKEEVRDQWCQESGIRKQLVCTLNHFKWQRKKEFSDNGFWAVQICTTLSSLPLIPALWTLCWRKLKVGIHWYFFWDNDHYVCTYLWGGKQVNVYFDMTLWRQSWWFCVNMSTVYNVPLWVQHIMYNTHLHIW